MIKITDLSYIYDLKGVKTHALSNVSISLPTGGIIAIKGKSGMGKSTFLKCVAGLLKPATGSILINDFEIAGATEEELSRYRKETIGLMFQDYNLAEYLSIEENILLPSLIAKNEKQASIERAENLMRKFGIIQYRNRYPDQLSGGEQQRVALCVALINDPPIILCDEPTGALDIENSIMIYDYLTKINKESGKSIMIVSHDPMVDEYASHIVKLNRNKAILVDSK